MAFVSKSIASPALLCLVMALVLVASTKAQLLPPTPPAPTPAPTTPALATSQSLCPAGFANISLFEEAKLELFKLHILLILVQSNSSIGGTTEKPAGGIDTNCLASILPEFTACLCVYVGTDVDVDVDLSSTYLGAITCTKISG
jgi:hypothetical protein